MPPKLRSSRLPLPPIPATPRAAATKSTSNSPTNYSNDGDSYLNQHRRSSFPENCSPTKSTNGIDRYCSQAGELQQQSPPSSNRHRVNPYQDSHSLHGRLQQTSDSINSSLTNSLDIVNLRLTSSREIPQQSSPESTKIIHSYLREPRELSRLSLPVSQLDKITKDKRRNGFYDTMSMVELGD